MGAWLSYRLSVSQHTGREWARVAAALGELPALGQAFGDGCLSFDQVSPLTKVATVETDDELADEGPGWSVTSCERLARQTLRVTPEDAAEAHRQRSLQWWWDLESRMLHLRGRLPEEQGATLVAALEQVADGYKPDPETGQFDPYECRSADALCELASSHLGSQAQADRATVVIHADVTALSGNGGVIEVQDGPILSSETLRRLACDARVELVAHGANGKPLGIGRARRTVPAWLLRQVRRRDDGCRFHGCGRKRWIHAHHRVHWAEGGRTDLDNLISLCPFHHRFVHERGWRVEGDAAGAITFVRPGRRGT